MIEPRADARWTNARCEQLTIMWDFWRLARNLNHSTGVVSNIQKLEQLAGQIEAGRFLHFLNEEAIRDRLGDKP